MQLRYVSRIQAPRSIGNAQHADISRSESCGSAEFFSQIRRTLGEFPNIDRIIFAIEGYPEVFYDWMELECDRSNDNCDPSSFAPP